VYTGLNLPAGTKGTLPKAHQPREGLAAQKGEALGETGKKKRPDHDHGDAKHGDKHSGRDRSGKKHGDTKHGEKHESHAPAVARTEPNPEAKSRTRRPRRRTRGGNPVTPTE
jgi:hypothetical protein